jgi:O-antigen/teichoic acid export membrane protein
MNQKKIGIILTYCIMVFNIIIGLFYTPFMLSKLGDGEYGIYSMSSSLISFITLLDLGLGQTLVRYISKARAFNNKDEEARLNGLFLTMYSVIAIISIFIGIFIVTLYPSLCSKTMTSQEIYLFRIVFSILLVNAVVSFPLCVFSSTINAYERFFFLKAINFLALLCKYMGLILLLLLGYKVVAITIVTVLSSIIMQIAYVIYCTKKIKINFSFGGYDKKFIREIFWFSFFIFLNLIIDFLYNNTDKLILGAICGTSSVTVYTIGIYFQSYFQELSTALSGVFLPQIIGLYEKDHKIKEISDIFLKIGRLQFSILSLALGGFVLLGKEFINLWVGNAYTQAYYIGLLIMLSSIIPLTQNIGITILRAMNLHKYRSYMYLVIAIVNVGISIPLAMRLSGLGAAIGTAIATLAGQILFMNWFYYRKVHLDINQYWRNCLSFVLPVSIMVCVGFFFKRISPVTSWIKFTFFTLLFCGIYFVLYWMFIFNEYEKAIIKSIVTKFKPKSGWRKNE